VSLAGFLCRLLEVYWIILIVRVVLSFVPMFRPGWSPPPALRPLVDFVYTLTDPPVSYLRRFVPQPMGFPFDLAFTVWFFVVVILQRIVCSAGG
jgi:YggT family protein